MWDAYWVGIAVQLKKKEPPLSFKPQLHLLEILVITRCFVNFYINFFGITQLVICGKYEKTLHALTPFIIQMKNMSVYSHTFSTTNS